MQPKVCLLGIGSAQGDDRLGWEVVEQIGRQQWAGVMAKAVAAPSRLLDYLGDCPILIVVDACRSGAAAGTVFRWPWPVSQLERQESASSHGLAVVEVLHLAELLGRLPPRVTIFGMEVAEVAKVADCWPEDELSPAVRQALPQLLSLIREEIGP